ncbi:S-adenosyl-L-methionine-dependent methyltransferase [Mycena floridula]|nr:S-adenosyl-L-methionine-dependent methyltransferase [Mycena floridula]
MNGHLLHLSETINGTDEPAGVSPAPIEHSQRAYQAYPGSQYALPTDEPERDRLIFQHNILKRLFDNKILFAPVELGPNDKVLDVGTGPGLWVLDFAKLVDTSVSMFAIDIESRLFPKGHPSNIQFSLESITNLPAEWTETFTFVHQRLLMIALQIPQWPIALKEIYRVLKPGGWVQLAEAAAWMEGEYPGKPCMQKLIAMHRRLTTARNVYIECARGIPDMLAQAGFVDIHIEGRVPCMGKWAGEQGIQNRDNHIGIFRGQKTPILEAGGFGFISTEVEYDELVAGMEKEWDEVPGTSQAFYIFWARKPLAS